MPLTDRWIWGLKKVTPEGKKVSGRKSFATIRQIVFFPTGNFSLLSVKFFGLIRAHENLDKVGAELLDGTTPTFVGVGMMTCSFSQGHSLLRSSDPGLCCTIPTCVGVRVAAA